MNIKINEVCKIAVNTFEKYEYFKLECTFTHTHTLVSFFQEIRSDLTRKYKVWL